MSLSGRSWLVYKYTVTVTVTVVSSIRHAGGVYL
jgi:hypothetical protein